MSGALTREGGLVVPTVDLSLCRDAPPSAPAWNRVAAQVADAARTVGFLQVVGHGIPEQVATDFVAAMDAFFALPAQTKQRYRCPPGINRGYTPPRAESLSHSLGLASAGDLFEAFNVGTSVADFPDLGLPADVYARNVLPDEIAGFGPAVDAWFRAAGTVARTMVQIFAIALGLGPDHFAAATNHSIDVLRMINYRLPSPDVTLEPDQMGMGAHTDYGIVTVLWADPVPGLEILGDDGRWHPVQPAPGALLINLGDALARWTNDRWVSTLHRVAAPRVDGRLVPRRSAAFFHDGNVDAVIAPLPSCVDDMSPARYEPITVGEHLATKLAGSRGGTLNASAAFEAGRLRHGQ